MSVALKAVAWAWRFTQTVKQLASFQGTGESRLPGPLEPGESQLPSVQSTGESFYCLYEKIHADLNLWAINLKFWQILENYVTYNLWKFQIDCFKIEDRCPKYQGVATPQFPKYREVVLKVQ